MDVCGVQISLDVRGKKTLEESLDFYCQGELMEGDNQYFCEEAGKKVCTFSSLRTLLCQKILALSLTSPEIGQ